MSWEIQIPFRSRDDPISEAGLDAGHLEDEDAAVTRQLVLNAMLNTSARTVGDLIDMVEQAGPGQRREILNRCRVDAGLDTVEETEAHARHARPRPLPAPMACAVCGAWPVTRFGYPDPNVSRVRRWHCPDHEHLAEPGDLDPPAPPVDFNMRLMPDAAEVERGRRQDERVRQAQAARNAERKLRRREQEAAHEIRERQIGEGLFGGQS